MTVEEPITTSTNSPFGAFFVIFLFVAVLGIVMSIVRYRATKSLMRSRGASEREATTMALFGGDNAVAAAALLSKPEVSPSGRAPRDAVERLDELQRLRDRGLIGEDEFARKRREILDEL